MSERARQLGLAGLAFALWIVGAAGEARAQQVAWSAPTGLVAGQVQKIDLVFQDCHPAGAFSLPEIEGARVVGEPTESRSFSMLNFKTSSSVTFSYPVRAQRGGEIVLPAFEVDTSEGRQRVPELRLRAEVARLPGAGGFGEALDEIVQAELRVANRQPFAGEVVDVELLISVDARRQASLAGAPRWEEPGPLSEGWGEAEQIRLGARSGVRLRNRLAIPQPGELELPAVEQELNVESGGRGPGFFLARPMTSVAVRTRPVVMTVQPLPEPAPADFRGAVGHFELTSKLVPEQVHAGEPVTWTLQLAGRGNWPDGIGLPPRSVPSEIRAIQPRQQRDFPEGAIFEGTLSEDLVLVPEQPGVVELAPVRLVYFDPEQGRYEVAEVGPLRLTVLAPAATGAAPGGLASAAAHTPASAANSQPVSPVPEPALESIADAGADTAPRLPRELLAAQARGRFALSAAKPLPRDWLLRLALAPGVFVWLAWLAFALRQAHREDPLRARRRAREDVLAALAAVTEETDPQARRGALLRWQRAAAMLLDLGHAVPGETRVAARAPETDDSWGGLWRESEAAIHAADHALAADWASRAGRAARRLQLPLRWPWRLLRLRSWLPMLAALALAAYGVAPRPAQASEDADAAYRAGEFARAEAGYRAQVQADPGDWRARYNLGLTHAQQVERAEALAQTAAAFLLHPRDESVRWNLALFARDAGAIDPRLRELAFGSGPAWLARGLPARRWQTGLLAGAGLLWLAVALALLRRFRGARGRPLWPAAAFGGAGVVCVCALALTAYGDLGDAGAALLTSPARLRSLPSEAEGVGLAREVAAGQVVRMQREFLAWVEVELANGERGWLRRSGLVPFYLPPLAPVVATTTESPPGSPPPPGGSEAT